VQEMIDICDFAVGLSRQLYGLTMHSERPGHRNRCDRGPGRDYARCNIALAHPFDADRVPAKSSPSGQIYEANYLFSNLLFSNLAEHIFVSRAPR